MARMPRWIKPVMTGPVGQDADGHKFVTVRLHIRRWHPSYWLAVVRALLGRPIFHD